MKFTFKLLALALILITSVSAIAQDSTYTSTDIPLNDTISREGLLGILMDAQKNKERKTLETSFLNLQWGFNNLLNVDNKLEMPLGSENLELSSGNSANFQVHIVQQSLNLYKHKLRLIYGLGVDFNNYRFSKNVDLDPNSDPLSSTISAINYRKNKLVTKFATIPLMLDLSLGKNGQGFQIAAGPNFGYRIGSLQKTKMER